jgi:V/A-type H+-transporting ATPase subunit D
VALREFALARAVMPAQELEEAILYPSRKVSIEVGHQNVMSVEVPTIKIAQQEGDAPLLPYGFASTSSQLDGAIRTLSDILPLMLELAEIEKTCDRLAIEIEKTRRRVNALEYVMIPDMQENIRYISMKLDENERGSLTRLMKVKDMIAERA